MASTRDTNASAIHQARMSHSYVDEISREETGNKAAAVVLPLETLLLDVIGDDEVSHCRFGSSVPKEGEPATITFAATTSSGLVQASVSTSADDTAPGSVEMLPWETLQAWGFRFLPGYSSGIAGRAEDIPSRASLCLRFTGRDDDIELYMRNGGAHALKYTYAELVEILDVARQGANAVE